jgi:hypothetical protein
VRKPFLVCRKRLTPWFTKFVFAKFFYSLFYIISTQRSHIYQKLNTNREQFQICSVFFIHPVYIYIYIYIYNFQAERKQKTNPRPSNMIRSIFRRALQSFLLAHGLEIMKYLTREHFLLNYHTTEWICPSHFTDVQILRSKSSNQRFRKINEVL